MRDFGGNRALMMRMRSTALALALGAQTAAADTFVRMVSGPSGGSWYPLGAKIMQVFDEKIGGTIHMAVGQSYKQTGGVNQSSIHWDMIADMRNGGEIFADGACIYRDGKFII